MEKKEMRAAYAETLIELGRENPDIVVLEADLMRATGTMSFAKAFPDRAFNVGVAEANMIGVASGLSAAGRIPFAATFGSFAARRDYDQFFLSANYARLNVKLVGTDPGVTAKYNGGTHMPFEDLVLMRAVPGLCVLEPSDPVSLAALVRRSAELYGCVYIRMPRGSVDILYPATESFEIGKSKILRRGTDVAIFALGALMVGEALEAAESLAARGRSAAVVDVLSLKPLDLDTLFSLARATGRVLACENGQASGGLGGAVAESLLEAGIPARFARIGVRDEFGEVGTQEYLQERFGLTAKRIEEEALRLMD
jgi:transketolase